MRLAALFKSVATLAVVRGSFKGWKAAALYGVALVCLAAWPELGATAAQRKQANVDTQGAYEIHIYHAMPGKLPALEARFRDTLSRLFAKHGLKVVGYWLAEDTSAADTTLSNTFIFVVAHSRREKAEATWDAIHADPEFQAVVKSEHVERLVERVDKAYMHSTDFSPTR